MPNPLPLRTRTALLVCGIPIVFLSIPQAATAQAAEPPDGILTAALQMPGIVVTATRSPEHIDDLMADVSVIDGDLGRRGLNLQEVLRFGGGCHGCGMADVTLKQGIEKTLVEKVPGVTAVRDATDHATGDAPYLPRGAA